MPMTTIRVNHIAGVSNSEAVKHWYLDDPKPGIIASAEAKTIKFRGWVVCQPGFIVDEVVVERRDEIQSFALTDERIDVAQRFSAIGSLHPVPVKCGFNFEINSSSGKVRLGYKIGSNIVWCASIEIVVTLKVEQGSDGWLFLGNDTNHSMKQFSGERLLSDQELQLWDTYFSTLRGASWKNSFKSCFLLAPAKEFCVPEHYPIERGSRVALDQFLERFEEMNPIIWPREELARDKEQTYWKGDTHWTDYGAYVSAMLALKFLQLEPAPESLTPNYAITKKAGDLGGKLTPPVKFAVATADFTVAKKSLVFDNEIHNHGRIRIYEPDVPKYPDYKCICFGDSFSVNMVPWLIPYFGRLVYVHSAAALDRDLLEAERPTHVIFQTNSRFIISPPDALGYLKESLTSKLKALEIAKRESLADKCRDQLLKRGTNNYYHNLMLTMTEAASACKS